MRYLTVLHEELRKACREQPDVGRYAGPTSDATDLVHNRVGPRRAWPKASADGLLSLAAAPTFAIMALLAGIQDGGMPGVLCSAAQDGSLLTGMVPMYVLMSAFHSGPWLRLITNRRSDGRRS